MTFMPSLREEYAHWLVEQHRSDDARAELRIALELYKSVGNQLGVSRVQTTLDGLSA